MFLNTLMSEMFSSIDARGEFGGGLRKRHGARCNPSSSEARWRKRRDDLADQLSPTFYNSRKPKEFLMSAAKDWPRSIGCRPTPLP